VRLHWYLPNAARNLAESGFPKNSRISSLPKPKSGTTQMLKTLICKLKKTLRNYLSHFYKKNIKTCIKTLNYSIHSSKKHRQYKSNKVNNTAKNTRSVQEMESLYMRNASYLYLMF